jgi:5-(carboxyamino)imidazole ribonucleotide synthase
VAEDRAKGAKPLVDTLGAGQLGLAGALVGTPDVPGGSVCAGCGYDLSGQRTPRCPECGGTAIVREARRRPSAIELAAAAVLCAEYAIGAAYFAVNPNDIAALGLGVTATCFLFAGIFGLGIAGSLVAVLNPRARAPRIISVALIAFAGLVGPFAAWMLTMTVYPLGEPAAVLAIGGLLTANGAGCLVLGHRLLYRTILHMPIVVPRHADVGILGAGQLGRMLGLAGAAMGVRCRFLDEPVGGTPDEPEAPARDGSPGNPSPALRARQSTRPASAVGEVLEHGFGVGPQLDRFVDGLDAVTYEFENVPAALAGAIAERVPVRPSARSLEVAQDRLRERELFASLGIATPRWAAVSSLADLKDAIEGGFPLPAIVKTRRMGYDGKGQAWIRDAGDAGDAWGAVAGSASGTVDAILDEAIPFEREVSVIAVRGADGETRCYPPVENVHRGGILARSVAPASGIAGGLLADLERAAAAVADGLGHVGVLAAEFFETPDGRLLANEFAPRVHNTGHWTIEGAETSQFENHLRAVLGWPLGSCAMRSGHAAMVNIIGAWPDRRALLAVPGASLHDYEKAPKPGRKIGHVTLIAADLGGLRERLDAVERVVASVGDV